jgi:hypothetical protein
MIGAIESTRTDITPYRDGKLGGCPWTLVEHAASPEGVAIGTEVPCPMSEDETVRISYEVRGRRTGSNPILVVGQANVTVVSGSDPVVTEDVRTFDNVRVVLNVDVSAQTVRIEATQHVTEDWEFQVKLAYDVRAPVVA